ncbi:succinate-semialdehyde dehydrogenase / glutarate-semialdehyde dehydrogenase [Chitinophaga costaii]|uniref:Succinate-semialdehyde dehydrogenase / glutarate-semialdehyde dehydrogenase n=1 Tax=Chitinophaga costaii TaxID=1335309 RepID=A0A1C4FWK5_9BACT|nr:NAD-dependent succinate-semialdehyde dehydrogenase [Chitinophaga costaii]PUZ27249.1 NAD-dependent succinate-semialdehyde dehydrogenase [Chitinophaga costaii]SCC59901.1 succinate-semialdehyde dehydrogenase / glutarate-semialdehyde dehydrogenase [Chitinophaga costaii]
MFKSIYPFTGEQVAEYQPHTPEQVTAIIANAARAFTTLQATTLQQRCDWMRATAQHLKDKAAEYGALITREMGKTLKEATAEVNKCADSALYYADQAPAMLEDRLIKTEARASYVSYQPLGTVLAIMPWNFPFWQVFRFAIPNLLAGNTGLLKHASNVSGCALALEAIFREGGFPEYAFQALLISSDHIEPVIADARIQGVTLTGSTPAGRSVGALAGKYLKKSVLELGGSDPFIVLRDADLDKAATTAVLSRMQNAGQSCIAAKRWIVEAPVVEAFTEKVKNILASKIQGDPFKDATDIGPMARPDLAQALSKQLVQSVAAGARLEMGGGVQGCNFTPALLSGVQPGMTAYAEETFGPLAAIIPAASAAAAIALANDSSFGLGASLWTQDLEKARLLAAQVQSGSVFVNSLMRSDARLPFGGIKESGYGRELSVEGMHEFLNIKTVYME